MRSTGGRWWTSRMARAAMLAACVMGTAGRVVAVQSPPNGEHPPGEPLLRPRWVPPKEAEIAIDPTRAIAGLFVIKFAEGSHVRMTADGLFVDLHALQSNPEELRRLERVGLKPGSAIEELAAVASVLEEAREALGFTVTPALRPPDFVYDPWDPESDAPFREKDELEQRSGEELADLDLYYVAYAKDFNDVGAQKALMNRLNPFRVIEQVYVAVPTEGAQAPTPNVTPSQGYLQAAPSGLDALYAWTKPGGRGDGVRLIDVEYGWVIDHEDFPSAARRFWASLPPLVCPYDGGPRGASEHGTAVMGVIAAPDNGFGVTGMATNVQHGLSTVCRPLDYVWAAIVATFSGENWVGRAHNVAVAAAMQAAADQLRPGDVLLVEQHAPGPGTGVSCPGCDQWEYVAMEYYQESFDVIRRATARGVIVVEAAGNGSQNLDTAPYGRRFWPGVRHSGALLVGGSGAGTNMPNMSSNSSQRVDVHAWGAGVTTIGRGEAPPAPSPFDSSRPVTRLYNRNFGGTSSASAIVAGGVASLQGARRASGRPPLLPAELSNLLRSTGSPQLGSPAAIAARPIGPQPNLRAAVDVATMSAGGFTGPGLYTIRSKSSGKALDIDLSWFRGQNDEQRLIQWDFHGGRNQQFEAMSAGGGAFWLWPRHTGGKVLDVVGNSTADDVPVQQYTFHGGANQRFRIEPVGAYFRIVAEHSGKVLEIPGFSDRNDTVVQQRPWNGGDNQLFAFSPVR